MIAAAAKSINVKDAGGSGFLRVNLLALRRDFVLYHSYLNIYLKVAQSFNSFNANLENLKKSIFLNLKVFQIWSLLKDFIYRTETSSAQKNLRDLSNFMFLIDCRTKDLAIRKPISFLNSVKIRILFFDKQEDYDLAA